MEERHLMRSIIDSCAQLPTVYWGEVTLAFMPHFGLFIPSWSPCFSCGNAVKQPCFISKKKNIEDKKNSINPQIAAYWASGVNVLLRICAWSQPPAESTTLLHFHKFGRRKLRLNLRTAWRWMSSAVRDLWSFWLHFDLVFCKICMLEHMLPQKSSKHNK